MNNLKVGDRVAYKASWLKSSGNITGPLGFARGVIKGLRSLGENQLATIKWDIEGVPAKVLTSNLCKPGANTEFCNCD